MPRTNNALGSSRLASICDTICKIKFGFVNYIGGFRRCYTYRRPIGCLLYLSISALCKSDMPRLGISYFNALPATVVLVTTALLSQYMVAALSTFTPMERR